MSVDLPGVARGSLPRPEYMRMEVHLIGRAEDHSYLTQTKCGRYAFDGYTISCAEDAVGALPCTWHTHHYLCSHCVARLAQPTVHVVHIVGNECGNQDAICGRPVQIGDVVARSKADMAGVIPRHNALATHVRYVPCPDCEAKAE